MSTNRDLFAGAIAEAKAVKNMAIENAKLALEETFTPQIKSMFSAKLREMEEEEMESMEEIESVDEMEEVDEMMFDDELDELEETEVTEELDLDELLAEIESEESEELNEVEEEEIEVEDDEESEETEEDEDETPLNIEDMTEEDLAKMIEDIMLEEFPQLAQMKDEESEEGEEELDLDLDLEDEEESDLDLAEMLREIEEEEEEDVDNSELDEIRAELAEAHTTINTLRTDLNEINVLNAKLLYTNKIFRSKNLNESQKVKVLSSFDKAESVKDVELVYETLNEGLIVKSPIKKQPQGSASKSTFTPETKKPIIESNEVFKRMQKLAGII